MLALRLARGAHPLVLLRRLLVAAASTGVGFLLLCTLGHAASHPAATDRSAVRLLWCVVPLAALVQLAVAVARADGAGDRRPGMSSVGFGPYRAAAVAAGGTAVSCIVGSVFALLLFLLLRGDLGGAPAAGALGQVLGADRQLPVVGVLTLLAVAPVACAAGAAVSLRPQRTPAAADPGGAAVPGDAERAAPTALPPVTAAPRGLPWGVALMALGLALEAYAGHGAAPAPESLLPMPGRLASSPPGIAGGWLLTAIGLVFAGPGLTHTAGRMLAAGRPGALRMLAGRVLQGEAQRIGRPVGVLCAIASGTFAATELYGGAVDASGASPFGPLTGLGAALVMSCATASVLTAAAETRTARGTTTAALQRLGAPAAVLRRAAVMRTAALLAVLVPVTWVVAQLSAMPLRP